MTNMPMDQEAMESAHKLDLTFKADMHTVEGILTLVQEWAGQKGASYDDKLSLRLVLEELLSNICIHTPTTLGTTKIRLRIEPSNQKDKLEFQVILWDNGPPFNPLLENENPVDNIQNTPIGQRGLSLVRLLTNNNVYNRNNGNQFSFTFLTDLESQDGRLGHEETDTQHQTLKKLKASIILAWKNNLAIRQTTFFTLYVFVFIILSLGVFYIGSNKLSQDNARALVMQSMQAQIEFTSNILQNIQDNMRKLTNSIEQENQKNTNTYFEKLFAHEAISFFQFLIDSPHISALAAEIPVVGFIAANKDQAWFFGLEKGVIAHKYEVSNFQKYINIHKGFGKWHALLLSLRNEEGYAPALINSLTEELVSQLASSSNQEEQWVENDLLNNPHASMIYPLQLKNNNFEEQNNSKHWIGVVIATPWLAKTLQKLSGFNKASPILIDAMGQYIIYPPSHSMYQESQNLQDDAELYNLPQLIDIEKKILGEEHGFVQTLFDEKNKAWSLPWNSATTLIYSALGTDDLGIAGWRLVLLIDSDELGKTPKTFPYSFILITILSTLSMGLITLLITSRTLRPLRYLNIAIRKLSQGDTDRAFPKVQFPDEVDHMLKAFDRVRVTLRTSFRNLILNATNQQRLDNELAIARSTQESMLPKTLPKVDKIQIAANIDMAQEVCGDLYSCFVHPNKENLMYFVMGDVCGKGIPAALIMSRAVSLARSFLMNNNSSPAKTLERLNDALLRVDPTSMFVTMLVASLDTQSGTFLWASAGHPPPMWANSLNKNHEKNMLEWSNELVLNVRPNQSYTTFELHLKPGQSILLYTDGASEAMGPPQNPSQKSDLEIYGEDRLYSSFFKAWKKYRKAEEVLQAIRHDIHKHMQEQAPADDISLLVITREK